LGESNLNEALPGIGSFMRGKPDDFLVALEGGCISHKTPTPHLPQKRARTTFTFPHLKQIQVEDDPIGKSLAAGRDAGWPTVERGFPGKAVPFIRILYRPIGGRG